MGCCICQLNFLFCEFRNQKRLDIPYYGPGTIPVFYPSGGFVALGNFAFDCEATAPGESAFSDIIYACGPTVMLKAVAKLGIPAKLSLEERMACGFGACLCCNQLVERDGVQDNLRVCCEGPVFRLEELV